MSAKIMGKVWDLELPHNQLLVLLALADHADHDGNNVYPSLGLIAWKVGYSEQQVRRVLRALEKVKILVATDRKPGRATRYKIDLSAGKPKADRVITPSKKSRVTKSKGLHIDTPDPLHFEHSTPDIPREENKGNNRQLEPSLEPSIAIIIKAWLDGQTAPPVTNQYNNKGIRAHAKAIAAAGFTPEQVTEFVRLTAKQPYWTGKLVTIGFVSNNIAAHFVANKPAPVNPAHVPFPVEADDPEAIHAPPEVAEALARMKQTMLVTDEVIYGKRTA